MRVLVVSHNVICRTGNMGKTIRSYFQEFSADEIAQVYVHSEIPTDLSICKNYYRFTDRDALKSLLLRKEYGTIFLEKDVQTERKTVLEDTGVLAAAYQYGKKRSAGVFLARDTIWDMAHWKTKHFRNWITDFAPDIVLYMAGDYAFTYKIAMFAANLMKIPLVIACVDDFYINNKNKDSWMGRVVHKKFMKTVCKTMKRSACVFTISDTMCEAYEKIFGKRCFTLHTAVENQTLEFEKNVRQLSYIGNLALSRDRQLLELGRALKSMNDLEQNHIDVYSGEQDPQRCACLTEENGIRFHGSISADEVLKVMENSMAVIHTESFEPDMQAMTRFSVSTKIAESLMYGPCLIAYGPEGIASIDYLKENQAAYVITSPEDLQSGLEEIIGNAELRQQIVANARALAKKNHDASINSANVRRWLEDAIREYRSGKNEDPSNQQCV